MTYSQPDAKTIRSFFDAIPARYDFLNSFLSFSFDALWRRRLVQHALTGSERSVLDIGAGTGKSLLAFLKAKQFERAVGCDFSSGMLRIARGKLNGVHLSQADLHRLPFSNGAFDLVTSSFVLRSVKEMDLFLSEVKRVLVGGGRLAFLDLTRPKNPLVWNLLYEPYLKLYIPTVGRLVSRHAEAYQFLSESIRHFVDTADFKRVLSRTGFESVEAKPLTFGAATIFIGEKP